MRNLDYVLYRVLRIRASMQQGYNVFAETVDFTFDGLNCRAEFRVGALSGRRKFCNLFLFVVEGVTKKFVFKYTFFARKKPALMFIIKDYVLDNQNVRALLDRFLQSFADPRAHIDFTNGTAVLYHDTDDERVVNVKSFNL